jgi:hypothetical protein
MIGNHETDSTGYYDLGREHKSPRSGKNGKGVNLIKIIRRIERMDKILR